jgi:PhnB protein
MAKSKTKKKAGSARKAAKRAVKKVARQVAKPSSSKKPKVAAKAKVQPIPKGFHTLTPSLVVRNAASAIEFYKKAFGATERSRLAAPDGTIMHAELKIGDSILTLGEEMPQMGAKSPQTVGVGTAWSSSLLLYTTDVDAAFKRAVTAGATEQMPVTDQFWGDRYGRVMDPYGHSWQLATHKEELTEAEMMKRFAATMNRPADDDGSEHTDVTTPGGGALLDRSSPTALA